MFILSSQIFTDYRINFKRLIPYTLPPLENSNVKQEK